MVARLSASQKIDLELRSLRLMLDDLPEVDAEWESLQDGERAGWSLDWDQLMGALRAVLDPCYRAGTMTPRQRTGYEDLLHRFETALPTLDRLGLNRPTVGGSGDGRRPARARAARTRR